MLSAVSSDRERLTARMQLHSRWFARYIYDAFGGRFGLANDVFPPSEDGTVPGGFAQIPYVREAPRLAGWETLVEADILPSSDGLTAKLLPGTIAMGNYANDHHYEEMAPEGSPLKFKLQPKVLKWGGRNTGTPFTIPLRALIPPMLDGLIVAEKSWSVSHIANGASRLQPVCIGVGQAAGGLAAEAVQTFTQPAYVPVANLQAALLKGASPPTLVPLFDLLPDDLNREAIQRLILSGAVPYPTDGNFHPNDAVSPKDRALWLENLGLSHKYKEFERFKSRGDLACALELSTNSLSHKYPLTACVSKMPMAAYKTERYCAILKNRSGDAESYVLESLKSADGGPVIRKTPFTSAKANTAGAITFHPVVYEQLKRLAPMNSQVCFDAAYNHSGAWMLITHIEEKTG